VHLVVTDPPYGVNWQSGMRKVAFEPIAGDGAEQADRDAVREVLRQCVRLTAQSRHLYVCGPDDILDGLKVSAPATLIWDKTRQGTGDLSSPWGPQHETIQFVVGQHRHAGKAGKEVNPVRLRKGNVLSFAPPTGRKVRHPSEKPIGLCAELIESSSRQGEIVLDPYAGTGATGVAAVLLGRKVILVEKHLPYAVMAVERIKEAERVYATGRGI
jgi:DNA modification methylase